ncbi:MAG TPA: VOC family protein [Solirubrobacterales bacterium]|nr:VOC family protein [Solirubrobacterales bacterium]
MTTISKEAGLTINELFAGVPVAELHAGLAWYERLFGGPPDLVPSESERLWRLTDGGWVYVVADAERAGRGLLTLIVEDLDAHLAELADRGIEGGEVEAISETTRKAVIVDPDGNRITLGENVSSGG